MKKKNILIAAICISAHFPDITFAQYAGGSADGHSLVSKTDVATCTLPTYANISTGGSADGHASVSKTDVAVCTLPTYANISTGGNADGHASVSKTDVAICTLPTYANISTGGSADGHASVSKTDVAVCTLPTYANISTGGSADGHAMLRPLNKAGKDSCINFISCSITSTLTNDTVVCKGNSITLTAGGGKYYKWFAGSDSIGNVASITITPDSTTTYIVNIANDTCSVDKSLLVTVKPNSVNASVSGKTTVCSGDSTILTASGGTSYIWSTGETTSSVAIKPTQDVTLTVKTGNGCKDTTLTIPVTLFKASTSVKITGDTVICNGGSAILKASGGPNYKWSTGATTETITVNPTQDENYKVVVTNGSCSDSSTITVKVLPALIADAGADKTVCKGSNVQLDGNAGVQNPVSLQWIPSSGLNNDTIAQPFFTDTITRLYLFTVSNGICKDTDSVTVTVGSMNGNISGNTSVCSGESTTLTASGGTSYSWSTGETTASINLTLAKDSTVSVSITNGVSCSASVTVKVNEFPTSVSAGTDKTICFGKSVKLDGTVGVQNFVPSIQWTPTTGLDKDSILQPTASPSVTTTYILKAANGKCVTTDTVTVTVNPLPVINAGTDTTIKMGDSVQLSAVSQNIVSLQWTPSTGLNSTTIAKPIAKPVITTIYTITGNDANTCSNSDSIKITVEPKVVVDSCENPFIPNAFSPNNNGFNDILRVKIPLSCIKTIQFAVFDRWGIKVFETEDISEALIKGWNGTYKGNELNTGVYVYYMKAILTNGNEIEQKGNVSLVR